jgi:hypothetical protein
VSVVAPPALRPPTLACLPSKAVGSFADDVAEVAERLGLEVYPEHHEAMRVLTSYDARGRFVTFEAGIEAGRQSGKSRGVLLPIAIWSALTDPDEVLWSAHMVETALKEFTWLAEPESGVIFNEPWLLRRIRHADITYRNSFEAIPFVNGATLNFRARSAARGRGLSGSPLFLDEWLFGTEEQQGALSPILSTRSLHGNARVYYGSSAAKRDSLPLQRLRRRALAGDETLAWVGYVARGSWAEPGCELGDCLHEVGSPGCSLDDESLWEQSIPLLDRLTSREFIRGERAKLAPLEFGREYLGWAEADDSDVVDIRAWSALADPESTPLAYPLALGLEVAQGGASASVIAAGYRADGLVHVEVLADRPGTSWLPEFLLDMQRSMRADIFHRSGRVPVASFLPALSRLTLEPIGPADFSAGVGLLEQKVSEQQLRHLGSPALMRSLSEANKSDIGDNAVTITARGSKGNPAPAMALVLAVWGLETAGSAQVF